MILHLCPGAVDGLAFTETLCTRLVGFSGSQVWWKIEVFGRTLGGEAFVGSGSWQDGWNFAQTQGYSKTARQLYLGGCWGGSKSNPSKGGSPLAWGPLRHR